MDIMIKIGIYKINDIDTSNYDQNAIKNSLRNLFIFKPGQRVLYPDYGNKLYMYLYQPMIQFTADKIVRTVNDIVTKWQPRVKIKESPIQIDLQDQTYYIKLKYYIPTLNKQSQVTIGLNKISTNVSY